MFILKKKLSRITENSEQQLFKYKEIDLLYGSEMKTNTNSHIYRDNKYYTKMNECISKTKI